MAILSCLILYGLVSAIYGSLMPTKTLGMYCLIADNTVDNYTDSDTWQPSLYPYQLSGANALFLTFIDPESMKVPSAMQYLSKNREKHGCPTSSQKVIYSVGGYSYSQKAWSWLSSQSKAESMAQTVSEWQKMYNVDGIDLDIESPAGNTGGDNLIVFAQKLRQLNPNFIITQPVYGYPQVNAENNMVNAGWTKTGQSTGLVDTIGIMVYNGLESLQYVKDYQNGTSEWSGFPITVDVTPGDIIAGIQGSATSNIINQMATDVKEQHLGGFMVWLSSVYDGTNNKTAFTYSGGSGDASKNQNITGDAWANAIQTMQT